MFSVKIGNRCSKKLLAQMVINNKGTTNRGFRSLKTLYYSESMALKFDICMFSKMTDASQDLKGKSFSPCLSLNFSMKMNP